MDSVILLMGGSGTRMGLNVNKVLLPLSGKPLYRYSLEKFLERNLEVILVIRPEDEEMITEPGVKKVYGGATRTESVYHGLLAATGDYVIIHDAARPFLCDDTLDAILKGRKDEAVLTVHPVKDTIWMEEESLVPLDREKLLGASTPQCAPKTVLLDSYEKAMKKGGKYTDDISLLRKFHPEVPVRLVKTDGSDFKVTDKYDLYLAEMMVKK